WITQTSLKTEVDPVVMAVRKALVQRPAGQGEPYRPLRAAKRALDLVAKTRSPVTPREAAFVASLPERPLVRFILASNRDDEDMTPVAMLVPAQPPSSALGDINVIGPFAQGGPICEVTGAGNTRLQAWGEQARLATSALGRLIAWPCSDKATW